MIDTMRLRILRVALSGLVNRHQHDVIDYLWQENRVLQEHLGGRRLRLTDAQPPVDSRPPATVSGDGP